MRYIALLFVTVMSFLVTGCGNIHYSHKTWDSPLIGVGQSQVQSSGNYHYSSSTTFRGVTKVYEKVPSRFVVLNGYYGESIPVAVPGFTNSVSWTNHWNNPVFLENAPITYPTGTVYGNPPGIRAIQGAVQKRK
jgi:hypothetical protein